MEYRKNQESQVKALMSTVDSLGDAIDLMSYGSPWRNELLKMSIRIHEMRVMVSDDLARTELPKVDTNLKK